MSNPPGVALTEAVVALAIAAVTGVAALASISAATAAASRAAETARLMHAAEASLQRVLTDRPLWQECANAGQVTDGAVRVVCMPDPVRAGLIRVVARPLAGDGIELVTNMRAP